MRTQKLLVALLLCACYAVVHSKRLQFNSEGKFKIVQFTDLHLGGPNKQDDLYTVAVQGTVLSAENPDLVVITGDLVSGWYWNKKDTNFFYNLWNKIIQPMVSRNISWAIVLGNHDSEGDLTGEEVIALDSSHPMSLTQHGPTHIKGAGNYHLPIYKNSTSNDIGHMLWMIDSGYHSCMNVPGWGCIEPSQVQWYRNESFHMQRKATAPIPGIAFFHIPLYEHLDLWNTQSVVGHQEEEGGICCSSVNTGMYSAMKEMGDIKHVFCGHDHSNDYYGDYYGVHLGYGRKTGYGAYGPASGVKHGARVIEISADNTVNTWLRLEDGSKEYQTSPLISASKNIWAGCCDMHGHAEDNTDYSTQNFYFAIFVIMALVLGIIGWFVGKAVYEEYKKRGQTDNGDLETYTVPMGNVYRRVSIQQL